MTVINGLEMNIGADETSSDEDEPRQPSIDCDFEGNPTLSDSARIT
jgi:hypothetical protein